MSTLWRQIQRRVGAADDGIPGEETARLVASALGIDLGSMTKWPRDNSDADMIRFYGAPGSNGVLMDMPFPLRLSWDMGQTTSRVTVHKRLEPRFRAIWQQTLDHYGYEKLKELRLDVFGGCRNVRRKRGGSTWSLHAFMAAWDIDPDNNQLSWGRDRAMLARPAYLPFWKIVEENEGVSLGRVANYDWMHFQFAKH